MMPRLTRPAACVAVALVVNLSAWDLCLAVGGSTEKPDSLDTQVPQGAVLAGDSSAADPSEFGVAPPASEASTVRLYDGDLFGDRGEAPERTPVYRKWWFWSIIGAALVTAAILGAGGEEEATPDLPDFPDPPNR